MPAVSKKQNIERSNAVKFPNQSYVVSDQPIVLTAGQLKNLLESAVTEALSKAISSGFLDALIDERVYSKVPLEVDEYEEKAAQSIKKPKTAPKPSAPKQSQPDNKTSTGVRKADAAEPIRSKDDFDRMCKALMTVGAEENHVRNYTLFIMGTTLGLRAGDLLKLKVEDLFTEDGAPRDHLVVFEQKTGKQTKNKITALAKNALETYAAQYPAQIKKPALPVFFGKNKGEHMTRANAYNILKLAGASVGLDVSTHTMRKTYGYMANKAAQANGTAGEALETLQMKYKHSDQRITMIYAGIGQDRIDALADSVDNILSNASMN